MRGCFLFPEQIPPQFPRAWRFASRFSVYNALDGPNPCAPRANRIRLTAMEVNDIWDEFDAHVGGSDEDIDLAYAALLIAATENSQLNIRRELYRLDMLADGVAYRIDDDSPLYQANTLSEYLFDELKFAGNHTNYYDPRNSFLNEVMERRLGIPITLSLLYIELGKRLNIPFLGIGMPAHFIVTDLAISLVITRFE